MSVVVLGEKRNQIPGVFVETRANGQDANCGLKSKYAFNWLYLLESDLRRKEMPEIIKRRAIEMKCSSRKPFLCFHQQQQQRARDLKDVNFTLNVLRELSQFPSMSVLNTMRQKWVKRTSNQVTGRSFICDKPMKRKETVEYCRMPTKKTTIMVDNSDPSG